MLKTIFSFASLAAVHTGIAAGISHARGGHDPLAAGMASCAFGTLCLTFGAFAGYDNTRTDEDVHGNEKVIKLCGLTGYALGSTIGFFWKH